MTFSPAFLSRPILRPIQPSIQWLPGVLPPRVKRGRTVTLTTHPLRVPRSRMSKNYHSYPRWRLHDIAGQLCFTLNRTFPINVQVPVLLLLEVFRVTGNRNQRDQINKILTTIVISNEHTKSQVRNYVIFCFILISVPLLFYPLFSFPCNISLDSHISRHSFEHSINLTWWPPLHPTWTVKPGDE
jgi:hypothetical protein